MNRSRAAALLPVFVSFAVLTGAWIESPAGAIQPQSVQPLGRGDLQCDQAVNAEDSLGLLLHMGELPIDDHSNCREIGEVTCTRSGRIGEDTGPSWRPLPEMWGDLNCDGVIDGLDLMISLKHAARLPYELPQGCGGLVG